MIFRSYWGGGRITTPDFRKVTLITVWNGLKQDDEKCIPFGHACGELCGCPLSRRGRACGEIEQIQFWVCGPDILSGSHLLCKASCTCHSPVLFNITASETHLFFPPSGTITGRWEVETEFQIWKTWDILQGEKKKIGFFPRL